MGFRTRCKFCRQTEFGNTATHRRHVKWHVSRGDAVVMLGATLPTPSQILCKPEEVPELERQGWTRKTTAVKEVPE